MATRRPDEDHELLCDLTEDELQLKGLHLAEAVEKLRQAEQDKADAMKVFAKRIEDAKNAALILKTERLARQERRSVTCRWAREHYQGRDQWVLRRGDTGDVQGTAPITIADNQTELELVRN